MRARHKNCFFCQSDYFFNTSFLIVLGNAGTIPDRGLYGVFIAGAGPRVGELDEEMVYETRPGDTIILGASTWRVVEITRDRVEVVPAPGEPGRMPFWRGDGPVSTPAAS